MEPTEQQFADWLSTAQRKYNATPNPNPLDLTTEIARLAYQAGADAELEECYIWVLNACSMPQAEALRGLRRPKPPGLKQKALEAFEAQMNGKDTIYSRVIRKALEALPDS